MEAAVTFFAIAGSAYLAGIFVSLGRIARALDRIAPDEDPANF